MKQINTREQFRQARAEYIKLRVKDKEIVESGRRGWTPVSVALCDHLDALAAYALRVVKQGKATPQQACEALGEDALVRRLGEFLYYEGREWRAAWVETLQYKMEN